MKYTALHMALFTSIGVDYLFAEDLGDLYHTKFANMALSGYGFILTLNCEMTNMGFAHFISIIY